MKPLTFKPVIVTHWESEDGRFRITNAIPAGFCAEDTWHWEEYGGDHFGDRPVHEFAETFEDAVKWCESRNR